MDKLLTDPGHVYAKAYDMVLNGVEIGGGSIRIHDRTVQNKVFEAIGLTDEQAQEKIWLPPECLRIWRASSWRPCLWS